MGCWSVHTPTPVTSCVPDAAPPGAGARVPSWFDSRCPDDDEHVLTGRWPPARPLWRWRVDGEPVWTPQRPHCHGPSGPLRSLAKDQEGGGRGERPWGRPGHLLCRPPGSLASPEGGGAAAGTASQAFSRVGLQPRGGGLTGWIRSRLSGPLLPCSPARPLPRPSSPRPNTN